MPDRLRAPVLPVSSDRPQPRGAPARWTVKDVLLWTTSRFEERGLETPRLDAEILTAHALGVPRAAALRAVRSPAHARRARARSVSRSSAGRRVSRWPTSSARRSSGRLEFAVDARVLVPRPDTETLVDEALDARRPHAARTRRARSAAAERADGTPAEARDAAVPEAHDDGRAARPLPAPAKAAPRIADVGTGSGAIAIALAKERPDAVVFATDLSARRARRRARERRAPRRRRDVPRRRPGGPARRRTPRSISIVANLPYIPTATSRASPPEVRAEPARALDGGADGLALVRRLVAAAPALLAPGGALALEIGAGQAAETAPALRRRRPRSTSASRATSARSSASSRRCARERGRDRARRAGRRRRDADAAVVAGRGALFIGFAKIYFMVSGSVQQILLPRLLATARVRRLRRRQQRHLDRQQHDGPGDHPVGLEVHRRGRRARGRRAARRPAHAGLHRHGGRARLPAGRAAHRDAS